MGSLFGSKPKDNSAKIQADIDKRDKEVADREKRLKLEEDAKMKARRGSGRRSLISASELGVVGGKTDKVG